MRPTHPGRPSPNPNGEPMSFSARLRHLGGFVLGSALAIAAALVLSIATPSLAADSLRITSPLSGATVVGDVRIEGVVAGSGTVDLTLAISEQRFGDCGPLATERRTEVEAGTPFAMTIATTDISDGVYCIVAVADSGRLSAAVGDVTIDNGIDELDGFQLPTQTLPDSSPLPVEPTEEPAASGSTTAPSGLEIIIPAVFGAVAVLALLVMSMGLLYRRHLQKL